MQRHFNFTSLRCGAWTDGGGPQAAFAPRFQDSRRGTVMFGKSSLAFVSRAEGWVAETYRIDAPYWGVDSIITGSQEHPVVFFTLRFAPKIYKMDEGLNELMAELGIGGLYQRNTRTRVRAITEAHQDVVGSCWVYQVTLENPLEVLTLYRLLNRNPGMPSARSSVAHIIAHVASQPSFDTLSLMLYPNQRFGNFPFPVKFQVERLARNGYLTPRDVIRLLPQINDLWRRKGTITATMAIRMFSREIQYTGPAMNPERFQEENLCKELLQQAEAFTMEGSMYDVTNSHSHIMLIHRVLITPAGTYLEGPEPETSNRVLRKYPNHTENFLRVQFADEDGDPIRFEYKTNMEDIYRGRFQKVLDGMINIGGQGFQFLGFSHSSLRSQTCWFMAPFIHEGSLVAAQEVIKGLGDFSQFRSPAKCAARIGQAFSDTSPSVTIDGNQLEEVQDVVRNNRAFSDGVGTISKSLLEKVWKRYAPFVNGSNPTCLQIRLGGAKGMVSLFTPHRGEKLVLRKSMVKFQHAGAWEIEVCGTNSQPLPMYLNRPFIKILEDLGVSAQVFLNLQNRAMEQIRLITVSPVNAAKFLEHCHVGQAARLPYLVRALDDIGFPFNEDDFLEKVVEISALAQLRDLKYRARIFVEEGVTLYGVMDETRFLEEGQVYCVFQKCSDLRNVLGGKVLVTRSPAMHPGDIQFATAVDAPPDSPLNALNNCIVFSQKGKRDLPSQLGGGDLDGDLYNVIYDARLMPRRVMEAADYPKAVPVDIGRQVKKDDMTSFFVKFMETDQLGRISMIHLQLADQKPSGTLDPACIKLAEMASQAVDFSKTGSPVDMRQCPRHDRRRPDFMAFGPHVVIEEKGAMFKDDDEDALEALDLDSKTYHFYKSERVLGQLYRSIDEEKFFRNMQSTLRERTAHDGGYCFTKELWSYVLQEVQFIQWESCIPLAREIRDTYESNLFDVMYDYSTRPRRPLSELEVFSGSIIDKSTGGQNRRTREIAAAMNERFQRDVSFTIERIIRDDDGNKDEALARSIACLSVGILEHGAVGKRTGELRSWKYIAAAVCLREVEKFKRRYDPFSLARSSPWF